MVNDRWRSAIVDLVDSTRLAKPDDLVPAVNKAVAGLDIEIGVYLVDHEQRFLHPLGYDEGTIGAPMPVDGSVAGRAFATTTTLFSGRSEGQRGSLWMPLLDGSERLGVLHIEGDRAPMSSRQFLAGCSHLASLLGHLIVIKAAYGDQIARVRRTQEMAPGSELLWRLLPPLTFSCEDFTVSAVIEPCYDAGGDGFDYAVTNGVAFAAIVDTTGRGLAAGIGTAVALSAMRSARVNGAGLYELGRAVDAAFAEQFDDSRFTTGVLMELDLISGRLRYINAGHPPPLILRAGKVAGQLADGRRMPLGLDDPQAVADELTLQRGDRVLCYTDGITEAHSTHGDRFGDDRLIELAARTTAAGMSAPETLRRLSHAVTEHLQGPPADDATLLMIEWSAETAANLVPEAIS
jgi:hypothetical protein